jgi:hypothetical protein
MPVVDREDAKDARKIVTIPDARARGMRQHSPSALLA